ncbi:MAG: DegV family protein [Dehalococcoidia bacterium]|jgi:DegV family protein with EDD domain
MQIVTDSGTDLCLPAEEVAKLNIHVLPLVVTLEGKSYREGVDMNAEDFYKLLAGTTSFPTTSTPSPGDFATTYRRLAATDPEILSIHMSSGLSGTFNSARVAAESIPEAKVTVIDTKTLSAAAGWQVAAAARAMKAGWKKEQILPLIERISAASNSMFTLNDLKYLIHGGRIGHMKGLIASLLNIRPIIGVEKVKGTYVQMGQTRTFKRAVEGLVDLIARKNAPGSALRAQVLHALNPEGAGMLRELLDKRFACNWLPTSHLSLVLGAHTGTSMVGVAYAPATAFADMP